MNKGVMDSVFQNDLLREMIGRSVIMEPGGSVSVADAINLRMLNKSWKRSVSSILRIAKAPVQIFDVHGVGNGELLRFSESFEQCECDELPFGVSVWPSYFERGDPSVLRRCMTGNLGRSLVELHINVESDISELFRVPHTTTNIHRLSVSIFGNPLESFTGVCSFVQSVLCGVSELKFSCESLPRGLQCLQPPKTLTSLSLHCQFEELTYPGPINYLSVRVSTGQRSGAISSTLSQLSRLSSLKLFGLATETLGLPKLTGLRTLSLLSQFVIQTPLHHSFPNLRKLVLEGQTSESVMALAEGLALVSLKHLKIRLSGELVPSERLLKGVQKGCPSISSLDVATSGENVSGLRYIFSNMTSLTTLQIQIIGDRWYGLSNYWDSVLLDVPFLQRGRQIFALENRTSPSPNSIANLQALQQLVIKSDLATSGAPYSLISSISFEHGFLRMPSLRKLTLIGSYFQLEREIIQAWGETGRELILQED